ncbi:hypothetical protein B0H19DRAFT_1384704 [Mycena capillaripes]|nr:hypothetical protein B0H19DRAFT_1384704 [Mycena capillaripes]
MAPVAKKTCDPVCAPKNAIWDFPIYLSIAYKLGSMSSNVSQRAAAAFLALLASNFAFEHHSHTCSAQMRIRISSQIVHSATQRLPESNGRDHGDRHPIKPLCRLNICESNTCEQDIGACLLHSLPSPFLLLFCSPSLLSGFFLLVYILTSSSAILRAHPSVAPAALSGASCTDGRGGHAPRPSLLPAAGPGLLAAMRSTPEPLLASRCTPRLEPHPPHARYIAPDAYHVNALNQTPRYDVQQGLPFSARTTAGLHDTTAVPSAPGVHPPSHTLLSLPRARNDHLRLPYACPSRAAPTAICIIIRTPCACSTAAVPYFPRRTPRRQAHHDGLQPDSAPTFGAWAHSRSNVHYHRRAQRPPRPFLFAGVPLAALAATTCSTICQSPASPSSPLRAQRRPSRYSDSGAPRFRLSRTTLYRAWMRDSTRSGVLQREIAAHAQWEDTPQRALATIRGHRRA